MAEDPTEPVGDGSDEAPEEHQPDGLDLARSMMRGAAGSTGPASAAAKRGIVTGGRSQGARRPGRLRRGETQMSSAYPDGRDPQALGSELERIIGDRGWSLDLQVRGVFARWAEIVGPEIGAHSTPETLVDGVLKVRTDSTAWATQLTLLAATVVRRLNEELGDGTVTVVEVIGPNAPSWKHGRRSARGSRGPRDTYG
ncbi:DciA family protein [Nocardioides sp. YIM 152588]|uniref:DUF721 domain-containing protein n=1 Tax=Nocardioides sp. YIM 152588 TaxID=3158259 RepID=UPI0032E4DE3A